MTIKLNIHKDFQPKYKKEWIEEGFTKEQTKQFFQEWNKNIELIRLEDTKFLNWYLNTKKLNLEWALKNEEEFKHWRDSYKNFGTCEECQQTNTSRDWCQSCNAKHFARDFDKWTSGNYQIDKFIQQCQLEATSPWNILEWIPYEQFSNIEFIAQGGFGKVEKAKWIEGVIDKWNNEKKEWRRVGKYGYFGYKTVALKTLSNSKNLDKDFLPELMLYKRFKSEVSNMVPCYGISKDGEGNYIMVMEFMAEGNLKEYLKKRCQKLKFYDKYGVHSKLHLLKQITTGLKDIHRKDLVHKDFHSGNIIVDWNGCKITDLGLCQPVDEADNNKVFGVMPYVAPEVLRGQTYTPTSDVYSLGMIMYEILTGLSPFYQEEHDSNLALKICQGVRPQFPQQVKYPQELIDLIKNCWNSEPEQRPTAREVDQIVNDWFEYSEYTGLVIKQDTPFYQQYEEAEEYNKTLPEEVKYPNYQTKETVWHSKPINTKQITELLYSQSQSTVETTEYSLSAQIDFTNLNLEDNQTEPEYQTKIEQPPK